MLIKLFDVNIEPLDFVTQEEYEIDVNVRDSQYLTQKEVKLFQKHIKDAVSILRNGSIRMVEENIVSEEE